MRVRLRFSKLGKVRFVGHRDVARLFERSLRKSGFPAAYSEGFNPRMRMSFGLALPTCYESDAEYLDLPIAPGGWDGDELLLVGTRHGERVSVEQVARLLSEGLPSGIDVTAAELQERGGPSLQEVITSCTWSFDLPGQDPAAIAERIDRSLAADVLIGERTRKGTLVSDDIRPAVLGLTLDGASERGPVVVAELSASQRVVRPSELLTALAPGAELGVARRRHQWIDIDGARREPMPPSTSMSIPAVAGK